CDGYSRHYIEPYDHRHDMQQTAQGKKTPDTGGKSPFQSRYKRGNQEGRAVDKTDERRLWRGKCAFQTAHERIDCDETDTGDQHPANSDRIAAGFRIDLHNLHVSVLYRNCKAILP